MSGIERDGLPFPQYPFNRIPNKARAIVPLDERNEQALCERVSRKIERVVEDA